MTLISLSFLAFTAAGTAIYFLLPMKARAPWLLAMSLFFYICADLRYLVFLAFSIISCYALGRAMEGCSLPRRRALMTAGLIMNFAVLIAVKYLPFACSIAGRILGRELSLGGLIVPLGVSFYTLQAASYLIDLCRCKYPAEQKLWRFALYMSYFPIIMQGPISRYDQLAPQLFSPHSLDYRRLKFGAQLMLWGFFKKLVIADRAAILVNLVFSNHGDYAGLAVLLAALLYPLQLYADFSGCVDISRGCAGMLGIGLMDNFRRPMFSRSIQEFWRRWHISLSSWFRDYVYIPLGGSRKGQLRKQLNTFAVFTLSGLWHGAGLNYIAWGAMHGIYMVFESLMTKAFGRLGEEKLRLLDSNPLVGALRHLYFYLVFSASTLIFRAPGLRAGLEMGLSILRGFSLSQLYDGSLLLLGLDGADMIVLAAALLVLLTVSLMQERFSIREKLAELRLPLRWGLYLGCLLVTLIFGVYGPGYSSGAFIYMNF